MFLFKILYEIYEGELMKYLWKIVVIYYKYESWSMILWYLFGFLWLIIYIVFKINKKLNFNMLILLIINFVCM